MSRPHPHCSSHSFLRILPVVLAICCHSPNRPTEAGNAVAKGDDALHKKYIVDDHGAIIRGDTSDQKIALILTGDTFGDGGAAILQTLREHNVKASFFLTGNFYSNPAFQRLIVDLKDNGHYLGAHSDKHLLYADWGKRDSLLVSEHEFKQDLLANYERMASFGISPIDAPWFLPPYEWYNATVVDWTRDLGFTLVNFSPGTQSPADYTYPGMGDRYVSSDEIYQSILRRDATDPHGLNGFMLLIHIGSDPRRTDKFYDKLDVLLRTLKERGYRFVTVTELLNNSAVGF